LGYTLNVLAYCKLSHFFTADYLYSPLIRSLADFGRIFSGLFGSFMDMSVVVPKWQKYFCDNKFIVFIIWRGIYHLADL
jgi:hypothetical protein